MCSVHTIFHCGECSLHTRRHHSRCAGEHQRKSLLLLLENLLMMGKLFSTFARLTCCAQECYPGKGDHTCRSLGQHLALKPTQAHLWQLLELWLGSVFTQKDCMTLVVKLYTQCWETCLGNWYRNISNFRHNTRWENLEKMQTYRLRVWVRKLDVKVHLDLSRDRWRKHYLKFDKTEWSEFTFGHLKQKERPYIMNISIYRYTKFFLK